jgi:tripartite-type tricarboxylate transporter receptor subunit TctC
MADVMRPTTLLTAAILALGVSAARAQTAEPFFARKTISIYIGYTAGGSYDLYGRLIARHLGRHIPGQPTVVAQNMPGAGSLKAANYVYEVAPKDGTALGVVVESIALEQALANPGVHYDAAKFTYVGRVATSNNIFMQWHTSKVQSIEDSKHTESSMAGTGPGAIAETVPRLLNALAGTKFKIISGYPASNEAMLAMERGEVEGAYTGLETLLSTRKDWLAQKQINVLVQYATERHRLFPDVAAMTEFGRTDDERRILSLYGSAADIGIALVAPPDVPADRLAVLRRAFQAMVADPEFLADAKARQMEVEPATGEALQAMIATTLAMPGELARRAAAARE